MSIPKVRPLSEWTIDEIIRITKSSWRIYMRCTEARGEHKHFSHLAYMLHSILGTVEGEFQRSNSVLTRPESNTRPLAEAIEDCKEILRHVRSILDRHEGIAPNSARPRSRGSRVNGPNDRADLSALGTRLTNRITIIMLQLDIFRVITGGQFRSALDVMRQAMSDGRAGRHSTLYDITRRVEHLPRERGSDFRNSGLNVEESWSEADERIWEELRLEFIDRRFSRHEVSRCRRVLMTYIKIKNDEGGAQARSGERRRRPSPEEARDKRGSRGRQEEEPRGRKATRRKRSSRHQGSRWSSSFETLVDEPDSPSRLRDHRLSTVRRETGLKLNDQKLFYGVLGAAAASVIYVVHEVHRCSRRENDRSRR